MDIIELKKAKFIIQNQFKICAEPNSSTVNPLVHGMEYPASTCLRSNYFEPNYFIFSSETVPDSKIPQKS